MQLLSVGSCPSEDPLKDTGFVLSSWMCDIEAIPAELAKINNGMLSIW
jgi:hypothetical protein